MLHKTILALPEKYVRLTARYAGGRYIRQDNRGLAEARNSDLRRSRGTYLMFLDADDPLLPNALEVGSKCINARLRGAFVFGRCDSIAAYRSPLSNRWIKRFPGKMHCMESDRSADLLPENWLSLVFGAAKRHQAAPRTR